MSRRDESDFDEPTPPFLSPAYQDPTNTEAQEHAIHVDNCRWAQREFDGAMAREVAGER